MISPDGDSTGPGRGLGMESTTTGLEDGPGVGSLDPAEVPAEGPTLGCVTSESESVVVSLKESPRPGQTCCSLALNSSSQTAQVGHRWGPTEL